MASRVAEVIYQFEIDELAQQRIPLWLSEALKKIICSLAATSISNVGPGAFKMTSSDYTDVRDIMAGMGWYVRRTAIWKAYNKYLTLSTDQVLALGQSCHDRTKLIPQRVKHFQKQVQDGATKSIRWTDLDEELQDIVLLTTKPNVLVKYLDILSLEHASTVHRALKVAARVECEDTEEADRSAELEIQLWKALSSESRKELELGWLRSEKSQIASRIAFKKGQRLEEMVNEDNRIFEQEKLTLNPMAVVRDNCKSKSSVKCKDSDAHKRRARDGRAGAKFGNDSFADGVKSCLKRPGSEEVYKSVQWEAADCPRRRK